MIPEDIRKAIEKISGRGKVVEGDVVCQTAQEIEQEQEAARRALDPENLEIGHKMPDGTKFVGFSPDTGKAMYVWPKDESGCLTLPEAKKRAEELSSETGQDYRVPTISELRCIFNSQDKISGFDVWGQTNSAWYWSSTTYKRDTESALCLRFNYGLQSYAKVDFGLSVRVVRS